MKTAIFAGELWHGASGTALNHGLREHGWDVHEVAIRDHFLTSRNRALRALARLLGKESQRAYNHAIITAAQDLRPEIMLTVKGSYISLETLAILRGMNIFAVNYYPDCKFEHPGFSEELLCGYDLIVTTKSFQVDYLRRRFGRDRIAFAHHCYSGLIHRWRGAPLAEADYEWDICYVGNASPYKLKWLTSVAEAFPDRSIAIFGGGWEKMAHGTALAPFVIGKAPHGDFYSRVVAASRINLALHFGPDGKMGWQDNVSRRTFEIPASGGFMLHIDNEEIRGLYDVPSEIDTFADADELCGKIAYYLERPELRRAMIERAHARCVPAHGHIVRAAEVADLVEAARVSRGAR